MAQPSSENTAPSSPRRDDLAVFSDETAHASSPPSSPPGFPWEQKGRSGHTTLSAQPIPCRTAFSVLGKRKALAITSDNERPRKKSVPSNTTDTKHGEPQLTQMQISFGQALQKTCKTCGMEYVPSSAEDTRLHERYHKQNTEGYDLPHNFVTKTKEGKKIRPNTSRDDVIVIVDREDHWSRRRQMQGVLELVQRELGAVSIDPKALSRQVLGIKTMEPGFRGFMYIRGNKCVGFMLVERIEKAFEVLRPEVTAQPNSDNTSETKKSTTSALGALQARRKASHPSNLDDPSSTQPIVLSKEVVPACLGISRIWTSPSHRRQKIAHILLDTAAALYYSQLSIHRLRLEVSTEAHWPAKPAARPSMDEMMRHVEELEPRTQVAFSQPTEAGARLARRWTGRAYRWRVYVD